MKFKCIKTGVFVESPSKTHRMAEGREVELPRRLAGALIAQGFMSEDAQGVDKVAAEVGSDEKGKAGKAGKARNPAKESKSDD